MLEIESIKCEFCEKKMEWIPCSERLPEEKQTVLVADEKGRVDIKIFIKWLYEHPEYNHNIKIIAWMPLPEPYKGEGYEP